jgi:hypothetical protein
MIRPHPSAPRGWRARAAAVALYGMAMGWLEAVVVVYIRALLGLAHGGANPSPEEMMRRLLASPWLLPTEQGREAATLVMLAAVGWLAGRTFPGRFGAFLVAFGVWDIAYYAALRALVGWPESLLTMDLLFLIPPHPWWYQPVLVPVAISCVMVGAGLVLLARESRGRRGA